MKIPRFTHQQKLAGPQGGAAGGISIPGGVSQEGAKAARSFAGTLHQGTQQMLAQGFAMYKAGQFSKAVTRASAQLDTFVRGLETDTNWESFGQRAKEFSRETFGAIRNDIKHFGARRDFEQWFERKKVDVQGRVERMAIQKMVAAQGAQYMVNIDKAVELRDASLAVTLTRMALENGIISPEAAYRNESQALQSITVNSAKDQVRDIIQSGDEEAYDKALAWLNDPENTEISVSVEGPDGGTWVKKKTNLSPQQREELVTYAWNERQRIKYIERERKAKMHDQENERVWDALRNRGPAFLSDDYIDGMRVEAQGQGGKLWWKDYRDRLIANAEREAAGVGVDPNITEAKRWMTAEVWAHKPGIPWITKDLLMDKGKAVGMEPEDVEGYLRDLDTVRARRDNSLTNATTRINNFGEKSFFSDDSEENARITEDLIINMRDQTLERGLYGKDVIDLADEMLDEARMKYIGRRLKKLEGTWFDRGKTKLREEQEQIRFRVNARNTPEYRDRITRLMKDPSGLISGKGEPQRESQDLMLESPEMEAWKSWKGGWQENWKWAFDKETGEFLFFDGNWWHRYDNGNWMLKKDLENDESWRGTAGGE